MTRGGPNRGQGRKPLAPGQKKQPLTVRLHPDVLTALKLEAKRLGLSRGELLEEFLRYRLEM